MSFQHSIAHWAYHKYIKPPESIPLYERVSNDDGQTMYRSLASPEKPPVTEIKAVRDIAQVERSSVSDMWATRTRFFTDPTPQDLERIEQQKQPPQQEEQGQRSAQHQLFHFDRKPAEGEQPEQQQQISSQPSQPNTADEPQPQNRTRGATDLTKSRLNEAINAVIQHNDHPDRLHSEKWSITINSLKSFSSSAPAIRSILNERKDEIDSHHQSHELEATKHNYVHRGKQKISDVIQLDKPEQEVQKLEVGQDEPQQQQGDHVAYASSGGGSGHSGRLRPGDGSVIRSWDVEPRQKTLRMEIDR